MSRANFGEHQNGDLCACACVRTCVHARLSACIAQVLDLFAACAFYVRVQDLRIAIHEVTKYLFVGISRHLRWYRQPSIVRSAKHVGLCMFVKLDTIVNKHQLPLVETNTSYLGRDMVNWLVSKRPRLYWWLS